MTPTAAVTPRSRLAMIVDDVMLIQRYVADILEHVGVSCTFAENGAAALLKARNEPIDFIVLDLAMPIMDGWQFLRELRADPTTADIPVVIMTAHGQSGTSTEIAALGAQGFIEKPFRRHEFLAQMAPFIEPHRATG